jgi:hypothetical protein
MKIYLDKGVPSVGCNIAVITPFYMGTADGGTVVKVLCYKSEGRWFDSRWCQCYFSLTLSFCSPSVPGVDSASNRNEYQEHFLGAKAAGAYG